MSTLIKRTLIVIIGILAGLAVWPIMEITISFQRAFPSYLASILTQGFLIGGITGAFLGSAEGLLTKNTPKVTSGALIGGAIGALGGLMGFFLAQNLMLFMGQTRLMSRSLVMITGWTILGLFIGIGEGIRAGSGRKVLLGLAGGLMGGLLGGFFLEKSPSWLPGFRFSRLAGLILFSGSIALAYSLLERGATLGIVRVLNGPLKGKQFPLVQSRNTFGASPKAVISLKGYHGLAQIHGTFTLKGKKLTLTAEADTHPLLVNEQPVTSHQLKWDDVIQAGDLKLLLTAM